MFGMIEPGGRAGLGLKASLAFAVALLPLGEHLHGDGAMEVGVPGAEHSAHAAAADELLQQDVVELLAFEARPSSRALSILVGGSTASGGLLEMCVMSSCGVSVAVDGAAPEPVDVPGREEVSPLSHGARWLGVINL